MDKIKEAQGVLMDESKGLEILYESLDKYFVDACNHIQKADKIIISGVGKSGIVGKKIAATFSSVGIPALFFASSRGTPW